MDKRANSKKEQKVVVKRGWRVWAMTEDGVYTYPLSKRSWKDDKGKVGEYLQEKHGDALLAWMVFEQSSPRGEVKVL